jgi:FkbM family methyltransferase
MIQSDRQLFNALLPLMPAKGKFIEIGSRVGEDFSLTLHRRGWSGYCIEADPNLSKKVTRLYRNAPNIQSFNYCVSSESGHKTFYCNPHGVGSVFKKRTTGEDAGLNAKRRAKPVQVPSITLMDFWEKQGKPDIDLLVMDAEGCDAEILLGSDFSEFRPKYIMAETSFFFYYLEPHDINNVEKVMEMVCEHLKSFGYRTTMFSNDRGYKKKYFRQLKDFPMNIVWEPDDKSD